MSNNPSNKPITRIMTVTEARHLFARFEDVHCFKADEDGNVTNQCPGWNWDLEHFVDDNEQPQPGGCVYKNSFKICECLRLAAEGHYVVEVRPKNEDDVAREREQERSLLEKELRRLKLQRNEVEEKVLELENKIRNL